MHYPAWPDRTNPGRFTLGALVDWMARIYLLKRDTDVDYREFYLGEKAFCDIVGQFGFMPEDREAAMADHIDTEKPLVVIVSVGEDEARETGYEAGYYRAAIDPHRAIRHCGMGLADILGAGESSIK